MSVKDMKSPMKESFRLLKAAFPDELGSVKFQRIKEESLCQGWEGLKPLLIHFRADQY